MHHCWIKVLIIKKTLSGWKVVYMYIFLDIIAIFIIASFMLLYCRYSLEILIIMPPRPTPSVHQSKRSTSAFTHKSAGSTAHCAWSSWAVSSQVCVLNTLRQSWVRIMLTLAIVFFRMLRAHGDEDRTHPGLSAHLLQCVSDPEHGHVLLGTIQGQTGQTGQGQRMDISP